MIDNRQKVITHDGEIGYIESRDSDKYLIYIPIYKATYAMYRE